MDKVYKIVEEWSEPTYIDQKTGEVLYESSCTDRQGYWVVVYDPDEHEIVEWVEQFPNLEQANIYVEEHGLRLI